MKSQLLQALKKPACYPHPVKHVETVDLGCSWAILTGIYVYKLHKPLEATTPDCSTLAAARFTCEEELRLNRRFAPGIYLDMVELRGSPTEARISGHGPVIACALRLRQFRRDALASRMLTRGRLTPELIRELARKLAHFHAHSSAPRSSHFGSPRQIYSRALRHVENIEQMARRSYERSEPLALHAWIDCEFMRRSHAFQARWEAGLVRECHG
jgi:aminoglycoside phosphotransferase family enzyme